MVGKAIVTGLRKRGTFKTLFSLLFLFLFFLGVGSALLFILLAVMGVLPVGDLFSGFIHYFYIHYKKIPLLVMVFLILAIIVSYLFTLVMSYLALVVLYSRGAWGRDTGEISLSKIFKRKRKKK